MTVKNPSVGKRVGRTLYMHRSAATTLPEQFSDAFADAEARAGNFDWNVVRISDGDGAVTSVDFQRRSNPPIIHRKELLLLPDHPILPKFRALTAAAEEHGLFTDAHAIGTRNAWLERIREAGLELRGHALVPAHEEKVEVSRHRTAIVRRDLSQPMQIMLRLGMVTSERSFSTTDVTGRLGVRLLEFCRTRAFGLRL